MNKTDIKGNDAGEINHELKTWPEYFQKIKSGEKNFELRKNDRNYQIGDILLLREWKMKGLNQITQNIEGDYTGEELKVKVKYLFARKTMQHNFGLQDGYCVMGIELLSSPSTEGAAKADENEITQEFITDINLKQDKAELEFLREQIRLIPKLRKEIQNLKETKKEQLTEEKVWGKIQEIIDKIGTYYTDGQRYTKTDAISDLKKLFKGAAEEQLSEEKVKEIFFQYYDAHTYFEGSRMYKAIKQICALSPIPQPVSKELIKEIIIEYEAYRNVCKENAEVPLALFEWLDGQELPKELFCNACGKKKENSLDHCKCYEGTEWVSSQQPEGAKEEAKWISVEERLPNDLQKCLAINRNKRILISMYNSFYKSWYYYGRIHGEITHWMPFPEPPKS